RRHRRPRTVLSCRTRRRPRALAPVPGSERPRHARGHQPDQYQRQSRPARTHRGPGNPRRSFGDDHRRGEALRAARLPIAIWLAVLAVCAVIVSRTEISTDFAAFLPSSPTPTQQILVDELREGVVSRLLLIGIEGAPPDVLAALSRDLTSRLAHEAGLAYVANGEQDRLRADGEFLLR